MKLIFFLELDTRLENECRQMLFQESSKLGNNIIDFHSEKVL